MATRYMVANATDWGSTGSWSATAGGASGASVPASGDTVHVQVPCRISANCDQSAVTLAALHVTSGMTSSSFIGTSSSPLKIGVDNAGDSATFNYAGLGTLFYYAGTDGCNVFQPLTGCGPVYLLGGTIGFVYTGTSGILTINGASIGTMYANGMGISEIGGGVTAGYLSAGVWDKQVGGGSAGVTVYGGVLTTTGTFALASISVGPQGRAHVRNSGTIVVVIAYPGSQIDAQGSTVNLAVTTLVKFVDSEAFENETVTVTIGTLSKVGYL